MWLLVRYSYCRTRFGGKTTKLMYAQSITNVFIWFRAYIKFLIHFRLDECRIESVLHGGTSPTLRRRHLHLRHTLSQRLSICSWVCEQYFRVTARHVWLWWRTSGSFRRPWRKHKKLVFYVCGAGCFSVPLSLHKQKCKKANNKNKHPPMVAHLIHYTITSGGNFN